MRIVCISDTHNINGALRVPDGDMLIHAGDATAEGERWEIESFAAWFKGLPHRHKVLVAGNHDWMFETDNAAARALFKGVHYLEDDSVTVEGLKIHGSPWTPQYKHYVWAYILDRGAPLAAKWEMIPGDVDILVTHCPPAGILDESGSGIGAGCEELLKRVMELKPRLHVFGHMHPSHGIVESGGTVFVNASIAGDNGYTPDFEPLVIDL
jgi:Icc-related predicted phosphoesterase